MENKNELKFNTSELKKYCQKELSIIRSEVEDILEKATENDSTNEPFYDTILDYLDGRIESLNDDFEIEFDAKTLTIDMVEIHIDTLIVHWTCNMGFGECLFTCNSHTNKWEVDSEGMSENFVRELLKKTFETLSIE